MQCHKDVQGIQSFACDCNGSGWGPRALAIKAKLVCKGFTPKVHDAWEAVHIRRQNWIAVHEPQDSAMEVENGEMYKPHIEQSLRE